MPGKSYNSVKSHLNICTVRWQIFWWSPVNADTIKTRGGGADICCCFDCCSFKWKPCLQSQQSSEWLRPRVFQQDRQVCRLLAEYLNEVTQPETHSTCSSNVSGFHFGCRGEPVTNVNSSGWAVFWFVDLKPPVALNLTLLGGFDAWFTWEMHIFEDNGGEFTSDLRNRNPKDLWFLLVFQLIPMFSRLSQLCGDFRDFCSHQDHSF